MWHAQCKIGSTTNGELWHRSLLCILSERKGISSSINFSTSTDVVTDFILTEVNPAFADRYNHTLPCLRNQQVWEKSAPKLLYCCDRMEPVSVWLRQEQQRMSWDTASASKVRWKYVRTTQREAGCCRTLSATAPQLYRAHRAPVIPICS